MDVYNRLLDFDAWAMHDLLRASSELSDEQLEREFDIGHRTVRETFVHLIWNLEFWPSLMTGRGEVPEPDWGKPSVEQLTQLYDERFAAFADLTRQLRDDDRLDEIFIDHWDVKKSMAGTILQVILHASEHRMEITHMLIRLGVENVPEVDLGARDYELLNC